MLIDVLVRGTQTCQWLDQLARQLALEAGDDGDGGEEIDLGLIVLASSPPHFGQLG